MIQERRLYIVIGLPCLLLLLAFLAHHANAAISASTDSLTENTTTILLNFIRNQHHHHHYHDSQCHSPSTTDDNTTTTTANDDDYFWRNSDHWVWSLLFHVAKLWVIVEGLFYLYFVGARQRLQEIKKPTRPLTVEERTRLYWQCLYAIEDIQSWGVGWFYYRHDMSHPTFDQIQRENVAVWFSWAFWHSHMDEVLANKEWAKELEWMIQTAENHHNVILPPGYNADLQCIRLNLDPVQAIHRPLLLYLAVYIGTTAFNMIVLQWWWQFQVFGDNNSLWGGLMYHVHLAFVWFTAKSPSKLKRQQAQKLEDEDNHPQCQHIVYWYRASPPMSLTLPSAMSEDENDQEETHQLASSDRDIDENVLNQRLHHQGSSKTPLVFIHGIGAGLIGYIEFLYHLIGLDRPIFCVELPYVSMRMVDKVPDAELVVEEVKSMLQAHGYDHAVFVSHSLGTAVTSWMMAYAPSIVAGTVLIDPICFLLHYPQVCFNFIHRTPKRLFEYIMFYGASRELYISHYISRHFQWFQCIYFADSINVSIKEDDLDNIPSSPLSRTSSSSSSLSSSTLTVNTTMNRVHPQSPLNNATVFLSESDGIVASKLVHNYLKGCGVDCQIMPRLEHAGFLFNWTWRKRILDQIDWIARNADDEGIDLCS